MVNRPGSRRLYLGSAGRGRFGGGPGQGGYLDPAGMVVVDVIYRRDDWEDDEARIAIQLRGCVLARGLQVM